MPLSNASVKLMIFVMVVGVTFPVFAFAFTFDTGNPHTGMIGHDSLMKAGIDIGDSVTHLVNGSNALVSYTLEQITFYVTWDNSTNHTFFFARDHEWLPFLRTVVYTPPDYVDQYYTEAQVANNWEGAYNWTHISLHNVRLLEGEGAETDVEVLWTIPAYANGTYKYSNVTAAMDNNEVYITMGRSFAATSPNLFTFANWLSRLVTGADTYGMPDILVWLVRMISLMSLVVGIMLVMEIIPL